MAKKKVRRTKTNDIEKSVEKGIEKGIEKTVKKFTNKIGKGKCETHKCKCGTTGGCFYFLGFLGAAIYYISAASGFWSGVLGFLMAMIWPLFLVLELFKFLA